MPNPTTNFSWVVPTVGGSADAWGSILNSVFDSIDAALHDINISFNAASTKHAIWTNSNTGGAFSLQGLSDTAGYTFAACGSAIGGTTYAGLTTNSQVIWEAQNNTSLYIGSVPAAPIVFGQNRVEKMRLDASGNLGIGTTPAVLLDALANIPGSATIRVTNGNAGTGAQAQFVADNGTHNSVFRQTGASYTTSGITRQDGCLLNGGGAGGLTLNTDTGAMYFGIGGVEVARIDTAGKVGIGNASPTYQLDVQKASAGENAVTTVNLANGNAGTSAGTAYRQYNGTHTYTQAFTGASYTPTTTYDFGDGVFTITDGAGGLNFAAINGPIRWFCASGASPAESMRLDTSGNLLIGRTTQSGAGELVAASQAAANVTTVHAINSNATPGTATLIRSNISAANPNNTSAIHMICTDSAGTKVQVYSNGGLANYSANNVNLSDARAKNEFVCYDDTTLSALEAGFVRVDWGRFKYNDQSHADWNHGYTAQGVDLAFSNTAPELVDDVGLGPSGMDLKGVYETDLTNIGLALLARALKRIEQLETQVARLTHG